MNNKHFLDLLEKAIVKEITQNEEFELWDFLEECETANMEFVQIACNKNYVPAYSYMANIYSTGELCPLDWNKAIEFWRKTIDEGDCNYLSQDECYIMLGDCYRLGNGVEKNYNTAWQYYKLAIEYKQKRDGYPEPEVLLLLCDESLDAESLVVSNDWWEYSIENSGNISASVCNFMSVIYNRNEERYLYWNKKASDNGNLTAKMNLYEIANNISDKKKIAKEIFSAEYFNKWDADRMLIIAKEILADCKFSHDEKFPAFKFIHDSPEWEYVYEFYGDDKELEQFLMENELQ